MTNRKLQMKNVFPIPHSLLPTRIPLPPPNAGPANREIKPTEVVDEPVPRNPASPVTSWRRTRQRPSDLSMHYCRCSSVMAIFTKSLNEWNAAVFVSNEFRKRLFCPPHRPAALALNRFRKALYLKTTAECRRRVNACLINHRTAFHPQISTVHVKDNYHF
jgi:hypothetical protein